MVNRKALLIYCLDRQAGRQTEVNRWTDTFILLVLWRFLHLDKLHIDVKLHCNNKGNLQQHELQLLNTYQMHTIQIP